MPHGITQCYLPPGRSDIPALTSAETGTRLSDPEGMQGWVDLVSDAKTAGESSTRNVKSRRTFNTNTSDLLSGYSNNAHWNSGSIFLIKKLKYKWRITAARPTYYFVGIILLWIVTEKNEHELWRENKNNIVRSDWKFRRVVQIFQVRIGEINYDAVET